MFLCVRVWLCVGCGFWGWLAGWVVGVVFSDC